MKYELKHSGFVFSIAMLVAGVSQASQIGVSVSPECFSKNYAGKVYSPYAQRSFPSRPLWGDSHLHTGLSVDAGLFGARLGSEDAYRFARGEEVVSSTGQPVKLARPLDWLVIADHSDAMGFINDLATASPTVTKYEQGARWSKGLRAGGQAAVDTALNLIASFSQGKIDKKLLAAYSPGSNIYGSTWDKVVDAAEAYNDPGRFTALIGFEWTSLVKGNNLHRNVIFRDNGDRAKQIVPYTTQAPIGSTDPLDLYKWMDNYEKKTGGTVLALAHNGNLSNGLMFPVDKQYTGRKLDKHYVQLRAKWEPMYEVTQIKGDGEAHPVLSPNDEFADYETWDVGNLDLSEAKKPGMLSGEYAREALKNGLLLESRYGTNPYKFGMVGSTDSHTALSTSAEDNFFGKHAGAEPSADRMLHPFTKTDKGEFKGWQTVASGLAAVWATENTREAIFDAMARKEVYATTGTCIMVRFFGGRNYTPDDMNSRQPAFRGYEKGVPMGGDPPPRKKAKAPTFMVYALRDPIGANLDRIQIVKGWLDRKGKTHEKVYDVSWSDNRKPGADGKLPPVGNTVDIKYANWTNTIGASELGTVWTDPDFNAKDRAYTSPIWYTP